MRHDGILGERQRRGDLRYDLVAHGDAINVGLGESLRIIRPPCSGQRCDFGAAYRVAGENLHEFRTAFRDGAGQRFGQVAASDDDCTIHGFCIFHFRIFL